MRTIQRAINPIIGTGYTVLSKVKENDGITLELSNDSHTIPYTEDGTWGNYEGCQTKATLFIGNKEENSNVKYSVTIPSNVTGTWNSSTRILNVTKISTDTAYVDINATYTDPISKRATKFSRRFTMNKVRNGKDSILVELSNDYHVFRCNADGEIENANGVSVYTTASAFIGVKAVESKYVQIKLRPLDAENHRDLSVELNGTNSLRLTAKKGVGLPHNGSYTFDVEVTKIDELSKEQKTTTVPKTFAWNKINDGLPAIIAGLTNDSHTLPTDKEGTHEGTIYDGCESKIELFRGGKLVTNGITYSFQPQAGIVEGTPNYNTGVYKVTKLNGLTGWVDFIARYEGENFTCRFTISKARQGIEGYTINMSNDTHVFPCQANGYILEELETETEIMVHLGTDPIPIYLDTAKLPTGIPGLKVEEIPTQVNDHIVKLRITASQGTDLAMNGDFDIPIKSVDGKLDTLKRFSWAKTKQGESSEYNYSQLVQGFSLHVNNNDANKTGKAGSTWNENKKAWVNRDKDNKLKGFAITTLGTKNTIQKSDKITVQFSLTSPSSSAFTGFFKIDFYNDAAGTGTISHTLSDTFTISPGTNTYSRILDCNNVAAITTAKSLYMELNVGTSYECTLHEMVVKKMIAPSMIPSNSITSDKINPTGLTVPFVGGNNYVTINNSVGINILDGKITVKAGDNSNMLSGNGTSGLITIKLLNISNNLSVGGTLTTTGATTLKSTLSVAGASTLTGNLTVNGTTTTVKTLAATAVTVNGNAVYHVGNKPTKADVGLSNVNNWGATTAVNSTSETTYATASAVKKAYDVGNHSHPYVPTSASCNKNWRWEWGGTPTHLWGAQDYNGTDFYVYSPSDLSVGYASNSGWASNAGYASNSGYASDSGWASNAGQLNGRTWFYGGATPSGAKDGDIWLYF
ncbi:MAG: tail fiber protein [Lachnospiraceae bacterium]|nr:tail fiber protein [Lachnospiraceae bacterium]